MEACCGCFQSTKHQKKKKDQAIKDGTYPASRALKNQPYPKATQYLHTLNNANQYGM